MKKSLITLLLIGLIIPSVAFASWYNPFSWFKKPTETTKPVLIVNKQNIADGKNQQKKPTLNLVPKKNIKDIQAPIVPVQQPVVSIPSPSTKTCMSGSVVPATEYCTKICPDGEVVLETLACRVVSSKPQQPTQQELNDAYAKALNQEYNSKVSALNQQILDIKSQYYVDLKNIEKSPQPSVFIMGQEQQLRGKANMKIDQINLQIQQLNLDYTNKFNQI